MTQTTTPRRVLSLSITLTISLMASTGSAQDGQSDDASAKAAVSDPSSGDQSLGDNTLGEPMVPAELSSLGTATVEETLAELKKDAARTFADHDGWIIAEKRIAGGSELWSFTPEGHDAYPAAVQRLITDDDEGLAIEMNIQCDAAPDACKSLDTLFSAMNENLISVSKEAPPIREPDAK